MKKRNFTLTFLFALLCSIGTQAQEGLVQGSRLDIGSGNELNSQYYGGAIGMQNSCTGATSLVVGYKDTIPDGSTNSFIAGAHNRIIGVNSFAIGGNVKALGSLTVGIGYFLKARNGNNFIMGCGIQGNNTNPDKFLENSYPYSLLIGFNSTKPTLTVGPSPNDYPNGSLTVDRTGKVAIGDVPVPEIAAKLHIRSDEGEDAGVFLEPKDLTANKTFIHLRDEGHAIEVDSQGIMRIKSQTQGVNSKLILQGKVSVNTNSMNTSYSLCVKGGILTDKVKIMHSSDWPDYVFASGYLLMPLSDLKSFVKEYHHLPEVPTENDIMTEGIEIGDMQGILLKKIEEMTLYILQQQEQIDKLEQRINELEGN